MGGKPSANSTAHAHQSPVGSFFGHRCTRMRSFRSGTLWLADARHNVVGRRTLGEIMWKGYLMQIYDIIGAIIIIYLLYLIVRTNSDSEKRIENIKSENEKIIRELNEKVKSVEILLKNKDSLYENNIKKASEQYQLLVADIAKMKEERINVRKKIASDMDTVFQDKAKTFKWVSGIISDMKTIEDEYLAEYLENKQRPAIEKAKEVRELRIEKKELIQKNKELEYELEYIRSMFPDLDNIDDICEKRDIVVDDEIDTVNTILINNSIDFKELTNVDKSILALEIYKNRKKKRWEIGRDFERYIGYRFENNKYLVEYYGIHKKLEDLGRDLIAHNEKEILIIQCKYWAKAKMIHEKHIAQLYGTTILYKLEHPEEKRTIKGYFITHTELSSVAKAFANALNVRFEENIDIPDYPMIKCHIGRDDYGNKTFIYHLPMDQQYDNIIMKNSDKIIYKYNISDAEMEGYRRAFKWRGK